MVRNWKRNWLAAAIAALVWVAVAWPANVVQAAASSRVVMSSVVGFNGFYSRDHWIPVALNIQNKGPAANAVLQVSTDFAVGDGWAAQGTLRWPIRLPARQTVSKQIAVPGPLVDGGAIVQCLVDGQVVAQARLSGTAIGNVSLVVVLSDRSQAGQFLAGSTAGAGGAPVLPVVLRPSDLPSSPNLLTGLTAIVVDPYTLSQLSNDERNTLVTWVKLGGMLVVTGTGDVPGWTSHLPLLPGTSQSVPGTQLAQFVGDSITPPANITVNTKGALADADVLVGTNDTPIIAELSVGRGTVLQTAFRPTQPALLGWPSNAALWTRLLQEANPQGMSALPKLLAQDTTQQLVAASDALAPLKIPSLSFWATVFAVYALLVGPLLFVVLRRWKAEPFAWLILPLLSIVTTVGIYTFGAHDRPNGVLTEGVGVLDLIGDGTAEAYGVRAFMSPQILSGFARTDGPMLVLPLLRQNVREVGDSAVNYGTHTTIAFSDVGRWGVRYAYTAGAVTNQGQLGAQLWGSAASLVGRVTNQTPYTLHNVAICWNGRLFQLGDLAPGQSLGLDGTNPSQVASDGYLAAYGSYNRDLLRGIGRSLSAVANSESLFQVDRGNGQDVALIVATTADHTPGLPELVTGQPTSEDDALVLLRQYAPVEPYQTTGVVLQ